MTSVIKRKEVMYEKHLQLSQETTRTVIMTYAKQSILVFTDGNANPSIGLLTPHGFVSLVGLLSATVDGLVATLRFPTYSGKLTLISGDPFTT